MTEPAPKYEEPYQMAFARITEMLRVMSQCATDGAAADKSDKDKINAAMDEIRRQNKSQRVILDGLKSSESLWGWLSVMATSQPAWVIALTLCLAITAHETPAIIIALNTHPVQTQTTTVTNTTPTPPTVQKGGAPGYLPLGPSIPRP